LLNARGILADFFESAVHFMDSVPSGQHGIAIVDIHMPECDGYALMEKMQDLNYRMPVILITGRTEGFTRDMALQRGASGFLKKPFREQSLMSLIEALEQEGEGSH
jgi:FixJ family two-component response regulator